MYIVYHLAWESRRNAAALGSDVGRAFLMCGSLTMFLWILYPVAWGVCEGGNIISPNSEAVFYGILDLLAKPVFGALLIFGHRNIEPARLGLRIRDYAEDPSVKGDLHGEKHANGNNGTATNGHGTATNGSNNGVATGALNGESHNGVTNGASTTTGHNVV